MASKLTVPQAYRKVVGISGVTVTERLRKTDDTSWYFGFVYKRNFYDVYFTTFIDLQALIKRFTISQGGNVILMGPPSDFTAERIRKSLRLT